MIDRSTLLRHETRCLSLPTAGALRVGIGYPNSYHVGMSSLAFQWASELASSVPDTAIERFFADPSTAGRSLECGAALGDFDVLAWSCSFELDAANLLATLNSAGIPLRWRERSHRHPLLVMGGAVASINPLPLAPAIDVFVLGAAERLWPALLDLIHQLPDREALLLELAEHDGYFVPRHHLDETGRPIARLRRLEKRDDLMGRPDLTPASHVVTPHTEYSGRGLVEMSRGCPEKCNYCWVSYNFGRLRCYPADAILERVERLASMTNRIGFVATAIGDHPEIGAILDHCRHRNLDVALSSLRIPAMREEVLRPLAESGARSVTIAPETGTDGLRYALNKPIPNSRILEAVDTAQTCGIRNLKMYFIIGLPGESDADLQGIGELLCEVRDVMVRHGRPRGRVGTLFAGFNVLVPKPYTPYAREAMISRRETRRRMALVEQRMQGVGGIRIERPAYRESLWQAYLSRGDTTAFAAVEHASTATSLGVILSDHGDAVERVALHRFDGDPIWQFVSAAPTAKPSITSRADRSPVSDEANAGSGPLSERRSPAR
ncbi:MAG: radical SAM protein [Holophagae bacterium]